MSDASIDTAPPAPGARPPIEHVVVLVMENRSFDTMLGFLDHPDPAFDGLQGKECSNPGWDGAPAEPAAPTAKRVLPVDPDHSHDAVMEQLGTAQQPPGARRPDNSGFVASLERKARGLAKPQFSGLLAPLISRFVKSAPASGPLNRGILAMHCHPPEQVPVISTLAKQFAVCTRWFCSVPGETWPNRNFVHAATSDGETNIQIRSYSDKTIFELLEEAGRNWHIYHDDTPQVWAFDALWREDRLKNWFPHDRFAAHVAAGTLPAYSFMEPNHRPVVHTLDHEPIIGSPDVSTSQHPGNNLVANDAYDSYTDDGNTDFARGEQLLAWVYETLRTHPEVFEKTLLVLTYDEHGGLYDHVPPPTDVPAPNDPRRWGAKFMARVFQRQHKAFDFTMLGPRVPAVLISPWISAATVDQTVRDHASVPSTLRALFAPESEPLTDRDRWSPPFHGLVNRSVPRRGDELPDLSGFAVGHASVLAEMQRADGTPAATSEPPYRPSYYTDFAEMTKQVAAVLGNRPTPAADADPAAGTTTHGRPLHALTARITNAFQDEARRLRGSPVPAQAAPSETATRIPTKH